LGHYNKALRGSKWRIVSDKYQKLGEEAWRGYGNGKFSMQSPRSLHLGMWGESEWGKGFSSSAKSPYHEDEGPPRRAYDIGKNFQKIKESGIMCKTRGRRTRKKELSLKKLFQKSISTQGWVFSDVERKGEKEQAAQRSTAGTTLTIGRD